MATFKPTILSVIPPPLTVESPETMKWTRAVQKPRIVKELGAITGLDIHPLTHDVLVTASRIHMYDSLFQDKRSFYANSHFTLFSASFRRPDGRLIVAGNQAGSVLVYDASSSKPLRDFNNPKTRHTGAVRKSLFYGRNQVLTFSDDKSVRLWDLADGRLLTLFGRQSLPHSDLATTSTSTTGMTSTTGTTSTSIGTGSNAIGASSTIGSTLCPRFETIGSVSDSATAHTGYVRSGCIVDLNSCIASGSYDSTVKLWDPRGDTSRAVKEFSVRLPIESMFANKSLVFVSAGKSIFVYDMIGGRILSTVKNCHTKTITSMSMYNEEYFMTGSLDGVLKVFRFDTLTEVTQFKHPSVQILNLASSDNSVVVGSSEGTVYAHCIKKSILEGEESDVSKGDKKVTSDRMDLKQENVVVVDGGERSSRPKLKKCDKFLKNYQFTQALDSVVRNHYLKGKRSEKVEADMVVSFMQELIRRDVLKRAMSGLKDKQLKRFVKFLTSNLQNPPFHRTLLDVAHAFIELFGSQIASDLTIDSDGKVTSEEEVAHYFLKLKSKIDLEFDTLDMMTSLAGQVKIILDNS